MPDPISGRHGKVQCPELYGSSTTYYVRPYAYNEVGYSYGVQKVYTTLDPKTMIDNDGNVYKTVTIGTQTWMAENLKTTKYRDSSTIPNLTDATEWRNTINGAYNNYMNKDAIVASYGFFYNFYTIVDSRKIAPLGWHVPSKTEWSTLTTFLGGEDVAGGKLREVGTAHWRTPIEGATNETGFTALPGDYIGGDGFYYGPGSSCDFWSSTSAGALLAYSCQFFWNSLGLYKSYHPKMHGYSVRCIKD